MLNSSVPLAIIWYLHFQLNKKEKEENNCEIFRLSNPTNSNLYQNIFDIFLSLRRWLEKQLYKINTEILGKFAPTITRLIKTNYVKTLKNQSKSSKYKHSVVCLKLVSFSLWKEFDRNILILYYLFFHDDMFYRHQTCKVVFVSMHEIPDVTSCECFILKAFLFIYQFIGL